MTMRLQQGQLQRLRKVRGKTLCHLVDITRKDGEVLRLTDLDHPLTVDGQVYLTASVASMSAERRDSGFRAGSQEVIGLVDGDSITIPDLLGERYQGATVRIRLVDWRRPWDQPFYAATKLVEDMAHRDDGTWKATLVGKAARLARPAGGRFGGTWKTGCNYKLGDLDTCRKNIGADVKLAHVASGTATSGGGLTLTHTGAGWTVNAYADHYVQIDGGAGAWQLRPILSNTSDTLTLKKPWNLRYLPGSGSTYKIGQGCRVATIVTQRQVVEFNATDFSGTFANDYFRDGEVLWVTGANAGVVSPIVYYAHANRRCTLFLPTPFDVATNDRGIVMPGCDGLKSTCIGKFANVANFGGSDFEPGAEVILEPVE